MSAKNYFNLMLFSGAVAAGLVALSIMGTSPLSIGPVGVTVWFLLLLFASASLVSSGLFWFKLRSPRVQNTEDKLLQNSWRQGWLIGGAFVAILALSSLRQLTLRDIGIILGLTLLLEVFLRSRV